MSLATVHRLERDAELLGAKVFHAKRPIAQEIVDVRRIAARKVFGIFPGVAVRDDRFVGALAQLGFCDDALDL